MQAQSSIIPCLDAFLGITHELDHMREYLIEMRDYMPAPHQAFLHELEALSPPVRLVLKEDQDLTQAYDSAVRALARFRSQHLGYADKYIRQPARQEKKEEEVGTGGTDFMVYLAKHCRETKAHLLSSLGEEQDEGTRGENDDR